MRGPLVPSSRELFVLTLHPSERLISPFPSCLPTFHHERTPTRVALYSITSLLQSRNTLSSTWRVGVLRENDLETHGLEEL